MNESLLNSSNSSFGAKWNRFWFQKKPLELFCLFRIFIGLIFLIKMTNAGHPYQILNFSMQVPNNYVFASIDEYFLLGFRLPVPFFEWLYVPTFEEFRLIERLLFFGGIFFTIGFFTRIIGPLIALLYLYCFLLTQFTYHHHYFLLVIVLCITGFSPCADYFSLDAYLRGSNQKPKKRMILPVRLLQVQVSILYFFTTIAKLNTGWFTGEIIEVLDFHHHLFPSFCSPYLLVAYFTLFAEGLLAFGLWIPKLRKFTIYLGLLLHLGIDLTMNVVSFSYTMMALYVLFLDMRCGRTLVLYDSSNSRSDKFVKRAKLLDWFQRVTWLNVQDSAVKEKIDFLDPKELKNQFKVISPAGAVLEGFKGWRFLLGKFPLPFLGVFLLYFPPFSFLIKKFYERKLSVIENIPMIEEKTGVWEETLAMVKTIQNEKNEK